ncbi:dihydrofolate reductase family protein [Thermus amyloliquefaciens]|uniref:dihydrofolate reductase family protein n=1 Tax=Thermus amyloliquefaciens TaxID=1449080 RepID=UPI00056EE1B8|nr:dihydrofolate reductase family protein [Thermus amyloliquefaciens]
MRVPSPEALFPQATAMGLAALWLVGGPTLAKALTAHLEEVRLAYCPVVLGQGRRFLDDFLELTLLDAETLPQGVLLARYRPKRFLTQEA